MTPRTPAHVSASSAERLLQALGADSALAVDVAGDLAEEYALRVEEHGAGAARRWYAREALRSAPHLLWSAIRHGTPDGRARLAVWITSLLLLALLGPLMVLLRDAPPARLIAGAGDVPNQVVVSTKDSIRIPMRVLDASGDVLRRPDVRYAWESGAPARVSPDGVVECAERGEAVVRATLGALVTRVRLSCQPVRRLGMKHWYNFVLGGPAQELRVSGIGFDGRPVTRIAADVRVEDPAVAALDGTHIRPLAPGRTVVTVSVGKRWTDAAVTVFEPVRTLEGLRPDQRYVLASVRLQPGEMVRWPLPLGYFWLVNQVNDGGEAPDLTVAGRVSCGPEPGPGVYRSYCVALGRDASVTLAHPGAKASALVGALALERVTDP